MYSEKLRDYFKVEKRSINQPILLSDLYVMLDEVDGVQSVVRPNSDNWVDYKLVTSMVGHILLEDMMLKEQHEMVWFIHQKTHLYLK